MYKYVFSLAKLMIISDTTKNQDKNLLCLSPYSDDYIFLLLYKLHGLDV